MQELNSTTLRAAQLEKTMKWWSDCTANWREKWGKVRAQRNKLRDEMKILKGQHKALSIHYEQALDENKLLSLELHKLKLEKRTAIVEPLLETSRPMSKLSLHSSKGTLIDREDENDSVLGRTNCYSSCSSAASSRSVTPVPPVDVENYHKRPTPIPPLDIENHKQRPPENNGGFEETLHDQLANLRKEYQIPEPPEELLFLDEILLDPDFKRGIDSPPDRSYSRSPLKRAFVNENGLDHVTIDIICEKLRKAKDYVASCEQFVGDKVT